MWRYKCPICGGDVMEEYDIETVKAYVGATHDCASCGGLLMIEKDLSVSDFGNELVKRYKEMGIDVSKEEAAGTYIDLS